MDKANSTRLKAPVFASLALAFSSFGDAFLYPFLPVNHGSVSVPVVWVGVLLSINRFVRIFSNAFVVDVIAKYGLRIVMIAAVALAIFSTIGYAFSTTIFLWLFFRVCWGLAFSGMRIGTIGYALDQKKQGLALGISRSIQELGPMIALFLAPFLITTFNTVDIFLWLAALSIPALYFAWNLPRTAHEPSTPRNWILGWPSAINSMTFTSAVLIDGIVVIVLGILFIQYGSNISLLMATSLAAFYLAYRRICLVALSPIGGWLADKIGMDKLFIITTAFVIAGLLLIVSGWISVGAVIVFTFYSVNVAITPASASQNHAHPLQAVAENATWRDIGAAVGTLLGGILLTSPYLTGILIIGIFTLSFLLLVHLASTHRAFKQFYLWK
jgi:MFS transporter, DHA1 family, multidrug resistance protein